MYVQWNITQPLKKKNEILPVATTWMGLKDIMLNEISQTHMISLICEIQKVKVKSLSHVQLFVTHGLQSARLLCPWDFPGKNTGRLPFPSPGDLPDSGIKLGSPALQADSLPSEPPGKSKKQVNIKNRAFIFNRKKKIVSRLNDSRKTNHK